MLVYIFILIVIACLVILVYSRVKKEGFKVNLVFLDNKTGRIIRDKEDVEIGNYEKKTPIRKWHRGEYIDSNRRRVPVGLQDPNN
jgi:hypothetical protein